MTESQLVKSSPSSGTGSASVSDNTATISWRGTTTSRTTTTRKGPRTDKRIHQRRGSKTSSASTWDASIPSYSTARNEEAVPGAVPVPGCNVPSGGHAELEDGHQIDRRLSSLVVASELVEQGETIPAENLEQRIHQVVETQLLMHHQNIAFAESILTVQETGSENHRTTVDGHRPPRRYFARSWRWLLVFVLCLVATGTGVAVLFQSSSGPEGAAPPSAPTMSLVELLQPWIVRNDADLVLLNDGKSPQWRALDWLSTDSIAIAESESSPRVVLNRYVLAVLYYATNGDAWIRQPGSYLQPTSVCEWNNRDAWGTDKARGVYCATQSAVQQISLRNVGLNGALPWELSLLETLVFLDLSENSLTGPLPPELGDLRELEQFFIYQSGLTGTLPTEFGSLTSLKTFWPIANDLAGPLPTEIGQMVGLESLLLHQNAFRGTLPTEVGLLSALQYFSIEANQFSGPIPTEFGQLISLRTAWIMNNGFTGAVPTEFAQLINLSTLSLEKNNLTGSVDDILCLSQQQWTRFQADCAPDTLDGITVELDCSCCTHCCTPDGNTCSEVGS